jgi:hypothetical protein
MLECLLAAGIDANVPRTSDPEGPLDKATSRGLPDIARCLLEHGARVNIGGGGRGTPLTGAVQSGSFETVRLLLEHGADVHVTFGKPPENALSIALRQGDQAIVGLLRSHGAAVPPGTEAQLSGTTHSEIIAHLQTHLGPLERAPRQVGWKRGQLEVNELRRQDPPELVLATVGMSDRAMSVPRGCEEGRYAELTIRLPADWSLSLDGHDWPVEWLFRIADHVRDQGTWVGDGHVISNGEPPEPIAPGTALCCFLLLQDPGDLGRLTGTSARVVNFYDVIPLYREERDLRETSGTVRLLELFEKYGVRRTVDILRTNVAVSAVQRP